MRELVEQAFSEIFQLYMSGDVIAAQTRFNELIAELEAL